MQKLFSRSALAAAALGLGLSAANADTTTGTIGVSATVQDACSLGASTDVAFGTLFTSYSSAVDATGAISVTCPSGVSYDIALDDGGNASSGRRMSDGSGNFVSYSLFRSTSDRTAGTPIWGQATGTDTFSGNGNGSAQSVTVYGRIPTGQTLTAGSYTDTVNITVTY